MVDALYLSINQEVEITINEAGSITTELAVVAEITDDIIILYHQLRGQKSSVLAPGLNARITYADQIAMYNFETTILEVSGVSRLNIVITLPDKVNRTQRRNYVRIDVRLPLEYYRLKDGLATNFTNYQTTTKDISGGGLRFTSDFLIALGTELETIIDIPGQGKINAIAQVVRCIPTGRGNVVKYSIGVEFTLIEKKDRERIIRYLFEHQRELRKKGLI